MKPNTTKKLFAFIIMMMFSISFLQAQCKGNKVLIMYDCGTRSYPRICTKCVPRSQVPDYLKEGLQISPANETILANIYYSGSQPVAFSFSPDKPEKISTKIFDMTGRLVKTFADKIFEQGEHKLQWDAAGVNAGIYIVQFNTGTYSETIKNSVIK